MSRKITKAIVLILFTIIAITLGLYSISSTSYKVETYQKIAKAELKQYKEVPLPSTTVLETPTYSGDFSTGKISYEDFKNNARLLAVETKILPWRLYPRERDKTNGEANAKYDATLEPWEDQGTGEAIKSNIQVNNAGIIASKNYTYNTINSSTSTTNNPFGTTGQVIATARTIADYKKQGTKTLTAGESYILAHIKDTGYDISKVQYAIYLYETGGRTIGNEFMGLNPESKIVGKALYEEAKHLDEYVNKSNTLSGGRTVIDNMESRYEDGTAGLVSYTEETNEFIIGPFSVNYVRKVEKPITGGNSDIIETDGTVVYGGIVNAKLYGIKNSKEIDVTNWEFVYPDVTYDASTNNAVRNVEIENSVMDKYVYPFPNETFYIKLPNDGSVDAISKLEFTMQTLNATGTVNILTGTYSEIVYKAYSDKKITNTTEQWHWRQEGSHWFDDDGVEHDTRHNVKVHDSWTYTHADKYWVEGNVRITNKAPNLYQVKKARIYKQQKNVTLDLGIKHAEYTYTSSPCIPLTMDFSGVVWEDGYELDEIEGKINGIKDSNERGVSGVVVNLYNVETETIVAKTTTGNNGKYELKYIPAGKKYYVEFIYDGMKYKNTYPLYSNGQTQLGDYYPNTDNYLNHSHAIELKQKRIAFNNRFYEITTNTGLYENMQKAVDISYSETRTEKGQISTVQEFPIDANTKTAQIIYPLHSNYVITSKSNIELSRDGRDKYIGQNDANKITIGKKTNEKYYNASTSAKNNYGTKLYTTTPFVKAYNYLTNINLGLIERIPGDFALKTDVEETRFTLNEIASESIIYAERDSEYFNDFDLDVRKPGYYTKDYNQIIEYEEYTWRHTFTNKQEIIENDELQTYVKYKIRILNQSDYLNGNIAELTCSYDKEYYYPVDTNEAWRYYDKQTNYIDSNLGYANIILPQLMEYPSWAIKNNGTENKENLGQIKWYSTSKYGSTNNYNINKMYTTSLDGVVLAPGETIDIYVMVKVERTEDAGLGEGLYIINDNADTGKIFIPEINGYRLRNIDGTIGGRIDVDSNPGNTDINNTWSYEDDVDFAPYLRIIASEDSNGKGITGYVWEDERTVRNPLTNQLTGNGIREANEKLINNIKVELVRLEYNKETDEYLEVNFTDDYLKYAERNGIKLVKYTGPQSGQIDKYTLSDGQYRFSNVIESGKYKVRFTYGTEEQFNIVNNLENEADSVKYNGQDYKSTEFAGLINYDNIPRYSFTQLPTFEDVETIADVDISTKIIIIYDESNSIKPKTKSYIEQAINKLKVLLTSTNKNIQVEELNMPNDNAYATINETWDKLQTDSAQNKAIVFITDGAVNNKTVTRKLIEDIVSSGIKILGIGVQGANPQIFKTRTLDNKALYYTVMENDEMLYSEVTVIYNKIIDMITSNSILRSNLSHATDYVENKVVATTGKNVYGRADVMKYSQVINSKMAHALDIEYMKTLEKNSNEWKELTENLSQNTKVTADSYPVSINFDTNEGEIKTLNLGLQEIPKAKLELEKKVSNVVVKLANQNKIIDYKNGKKTNLQIFPNDRYIAYMDEEIMHGATIEVEYEFYINNIGEVDNLLSYLKYYPNNVKRSIYKKITGEEINDTELEKALLKTITIKINALNDYYDNLQFRAENNNKTMILNKTIDTTYEENIEPQINRDIYNHILYTDDNNNIRKESTLWSTVGKSQLGGMLLNKETTESVQKYSTVRTESLKSIELYPNQSKEVRDNQQTAAITTYLTLSKGLATNDINTPNMLDYRNFAEIIETQSDTGRREYSSIYGNYKPNTEITEPDSDKAELVQILPPFGGKTTQTVTITTTLITILVLSLGVITIKKQKNAIQR